MKNTNLIIRHETKKDINTITHVTVAAFMHLEISSQTEHYIVHALRRAGALSLSLVAEMDDQIVGHLAFSPVSIADGSTGWYGLGPISVLPGFQKQGVGTALIREGIGQLKQKGAQGCALVGDPEYYRRHGFKNNPGLVYEGIPPEFFMVLPLGNTLHRGRVTFHEGFQATR
ncbi:GNAT family N-acetyltransferase [Desulfoluna sp.]|uniref:GNAT family N-acetyltransferase n=1 Tax=Desulfoluna sp. TaxID=2045199 RepID=UPI002630FE84|nr:N-acetyltransferase [Desulfoluna sp.]